MRPPTYNTHWETHISHAVEEIFEIFFVDLGLTPDITLTTELGIEIIHDTISV